MKAFTVAHEGEEFIVLPPKNIDEIVERLQEGFDQADVAFDNGLIKDRRRPFIPKGGVTFYVVGYSEDEPSWLEDRITKWVANYVYEKIGRRCSASGAFTIATNLREQLFVVAFEITAFTARN